MINIPDPTLTAVKVLSQPDTASVNDYTIQTLLRQHIEQQTGRKVFGRIAVTQVTEYYELGSHQGTAMCSAKATLETK